MASDSVNEDGGESVQQFWKSIYEQENLAVRMAEIAAMKTDGYTFDCPSYGSVQLLMQPATVLGDNFMSDTYYNTAILSSGVQRKAFVKVLPRNVLLRMGATSQKLYNREIASYCHFHPLLREIRSEAGVDKKDIPLNVPEIYYTNLDETEGESDNLTVLVMEELNAQGFRMVDKTVGCTAEEARLTLSTLANYHALSIMLLKKYKNDDGSYSLPESMQYALTPVQFTVECGSMLSNALPTYIQMIKHLGHEKAGTWLEEQSPKAKELLTPELLSQCGPLACILHGDCWNNNMLYRHKNSDGEAVAMRLVDWQILLPGRPGKDVAHFLFTSTKTEMRKQSGHQLISDYVGTLMSALKKLGFSFDEEGFDRQTFIDEIKHQFLFGLFQGLLVLPAILDSALVTRMTEKTNDPSAKNQKPEDVFKDTEGLFTLDTLLENKELCRRMIDLVEEIQEIIQ